MAVASEDGARVLVSGAVRFTARQVWFDAERRLEASAASGVDAEVVCPFPPLLNYRLPALAGRDLARWVNEYIAGLCAAAPGRIYGLGGRNHAAGRCGLCSFRPPNLTTSRGTTASGSWGSLPRSYSH
ncbi:MAG TPA: hypothetical protein VFQ68_17570 [Streptosporangiaceae bacterium]|nr:hypothetical protein [Streptosporangiaceae bacterium]